jgi:endonuclease I
MKKSLFVLLTTLLISSCQFPSTPSISESSTPVSSLVSSSPSEIPSTESTSLDISSSSSHSSEVVTSTSSSPDVVIETLTISRSTWPSLGIYPTQESSVTFNSFQFSYHYAGNYTAGYIQGRRNDFYLFNEDTFIHLIDLRLKLRDAQDNHTVYVGSSRNPQDLSISAQKPSDNDYVYDIQSEGSYGFFRLENGGNAIYIESITIRYATEAVIITSSESSTSSTSSTSTTSSSPSISSSETSSSTTVTVISNAPTYYQSISPSLTGDALKNALDVLISSNISVSYDWSRFEYIDEHPDDATRVLTIYPKLSYLKSAKVSGTASNHWNREHTYPQAKISGAALDDNHHIFADDWKTNGARGNNKFGNVANIAANSVYDSGNRPTQNFVAGGLFEPNDEAKGEVARATLYMNTLYGYSLDNNFASAELAVLWALEYPVNDWAMTRNNRVYDKQRNRNPYIDRPEWICDVYGTISTTTRSVCGL